ncbi:MAG: sulfatase/phosphatase domain-containing protein, partial [Verrucomicrobiota bacterium]|nr:sulfatase/phosphatase domain-containing protein [Verrucomicrobiota bacterium]
GGKASKYEGGVCQPFIVNAPGLVPGGRETDALTDFSDLLPTFAELGQAQLPKSVTLDGKSFAPLLLGQADDSPRDWIMALGHGAGRLDEKGVRGTRDFADRVFRDKRYKVWLGNKPEITALYDLENDPLELNNLLKSTKPEHLAALKKFRGIIDSQPKIDGRPLYRPRKANPWDKSVNAQSAKEKKPRLKRDRRRQRKAAQQ